MTRGFSAYYHQEQLFALSFNGLFDSHWMVLLTTVSKHYIRLAVLHAWFHHQAKSIADEFTKKTG